MATGYTYEVEEGKITEFKDFVWRCARQFGALIHLRDSPMDAPIRIEDIRKFAGGDCDEYYASCLAEAKTQLAKLKGMDSQAVAEEVERHNQESQSKYAHDLLEFTTKSARYERMIAQTEAWQAPEMHVKLKEFMLQQLRESLEWLHVPSEPVPEDPENWLQYEISSAERDITYYTSQMSEDAQRGAERVNWVQALIDSVGHPNA